MKRIASTRVLRNTRIFKRSWYLSRPFETNFAYSLRDIRVGRSPHMDGDGDREGTAGDTDVGCRWCRAHLPATTRAALCGRSPACIRPVSRPQGPPNRSRAPEEMPELRAAISQAALLRKSSPDSGAGCAGSDVLSDVQDDRRSGTYRGPACINRAQVESARFLGVNFRTCRLLLDIALGLVPSQSISREVCKLSCLCALCTLRCPHIQTFMTVSPVCRCVRVRESTSRRHRPPPFRPAISQ